MERARVEAAIRTAFAGVRLGSGVSLRQAQAIDKYLEGITQAEFEALPQDEVTDDWAAIPASELESDNIAHLDAEGLRYYLPALMLWLLDHYNDEDQQLRGDAEMTAIGTIGALAFLPDSDRYRRPMYGAFTPAQLAAIASYLEALPRMVDLDYEDATRVAWSLDRYWAKFIPDTP